jgi:hypothetical protein
VSWRVLIVVELAHDSIVEAELRADELAAELRRQGDVLAAGVARPQDLEG